MRNQVFQQLIEQLRERTGASRTTLRLATPGDVFPVVAESCASGVRSIREDQTIDLRKASTVLHLRQTLSPLIQDDTMAADPPPPRELIEIYGARAQMLGPVVEGGALEGIISVHHGPDPRRWTAEDRAHLDAAVARVKSELGLSREPHEARRGVDERRR